MKSVVLRSVAVFVVIFPYTMIILSALLPSREIKQKFDHEDRAIFDAMQSKILDLESRIDREEIRSAKSSRDGVRDAIKIIESLYDRISKLEDRYDMNLKVLNDIDSSLIDRTMRLEREMMERQAKEKDGLKAIPRAE